MANIICPKCGAELPEGVLVCEVCGASLKSEYDMCPDCQSHIKKGALFCSECGAKVNEHSTPVGDYSFIDAAKEDTTPQVSGVETGKHEVFLGEGTVAVQEPLPEPEPVSQLHPEPSPRPAAAAIGDPAAAKMYTPPQAARQRTPPPQQTPYPPTGFSRNAQPPKGSKFAPISTWGYIGIILLFNIPVIGWIFCLVWACGGCTKVNKSNLARAYILIFLMAVLILAVISSLLFFFAYSWIEPYINMLLSLDLKPVY